MATLVETLKLDSSENETCRGALVPGHFPESEFKLANEEVQ